MLQIILTALETCDCDAVSFKG